MNTVPEAQPRLLRSGSRLAAMFGNEQDPSPAPPPRRSRSGPRESRDSFEPPREPRVWINTSGSISSENDFRLSPMPPVADVNEVDSMSRALEIVGLGAQVRIPQFFGKAGGNVQAWLDNFEMTATANKWSDARKCKKFPIYTER